MEPEGSLQCQQQSSTGLCWARSIQRIPHPISLRSVLILTRHRWLGLLLDVFFLAFPPKSYMDSSTPRSCYMPCPSHPPCRDHSKSTSYEAPHYAVFSSLLLFHPSWTQIFSSAPCSQTPSNYVLLLMSEIKFHTLKTTGKIIVLCILKFTFLDSRREDKWCWTKWWQTLREFNLLLIFWWIKYWFVPVVPKYFNFSTH
jgi:cellulose synthase/poly-beta-1,6-N-acetylglucosamine synthase-like glycosyltransferase